MKNLDAELHREEEYGAVEVNWIITRWILLNSDRNKGEGGWTPTHKLALIQLVETE